MDIYLLRSLTWLDFRLAVVFTVIAPFVLLIWAFKAKNQVILRSLTIYWRVSSLLAISVYLLISYQSIGFFTGWLARILIVLALWFWQDLNADINRRPGKLALIYTSWRWAMTVYCSVGVIFGINYLSCGFAEFSQLDGRCKILLEAPLQFKSIFHSGTPIENLTLVAIASAAVYGIYFARFLVFSLPKQGRIAFRD